MAGRGRAATLPAWMTGQPQAVPGAPAPGGLSRLPQAVVATGAGVVGPMAGARPTGVGGTAGEWTTHRGPDGRAYYYHAPSKRSTYEKPAELMTAMERVDATTKWKEHAAPDGRTYYYHKETKETRWTLPDELRVVREAAMRAEAAMAEAATSAPAAAAGAKDTTAAAAAKKKQTPPPSVSAPKVYATKDEAKAAFKELLAEKGATSTMKWEECMRLVIMDARYGALKTLGEKKQCFNEYVTQRAKAEREAKRLAEKRARGEFKELLAERTEELGITPTTRLRDVAEDLSGEDRWIALKESREREDLFREYCDDLKLRLREERKAKRRGAMDGYKALLLERGVKVTSQWRKVHEQCGDDPRAKACDRVDQLEVFQTLVEELEREEAADREREREVRLREERKRRDAFVELLGSKRVAGEIPLRLPWRKFVKRIANEPAYEAICANLSGSRPRELYEDVQEELEAQAATDRKLVETSGVAITADTDPVQLAKAVEAALVAKGGSMVPPASRLHVACVDTVAGAKDRLRREARRRARALDDFAHLLRSARREVRAGTTWEEAEAALGDESAWRRAVGAFVTSERSAERDGPTGEAGSIGATDGPAGSINPALVEEARAVFDEWVAKLAAREAKAREGLEEGEALPEDWDQKRERGWDGDDDRGGKRAKKEKKEKKEKRKSVEKEEGEL